MYKQDLQEHLDKLISTLEQTILAKISLRNTYSPVSRLPVELLGRVFAFASHFPAYPSLYDLFSTPLPPEDRFNFCFVSRDWRDVAINNPELWGCIHSTFPEWARLCLERSKASPLQVYASLSGTSSPKCSVAKLLEQAFKSHSCRIQDLVLQVKTCFSQSGVRGAQVLLDKLPESCPELQILRVDIDRFRPKSSPLHIPAGKFVDASPYALELYGCNLDWQSPLLVGLRCLKIGPVHSPPSPSSFVEALHQMPALEILHLNNVLPKSDSTIPSIPIELRRLQDLRIQSIVDILPFWLQHFKIPSTATTDINTFVDFESGDSTIADGQLSLLAKSLEVFFHSMASGPTSSSQHFGTLSIIRPTYHRVKFVGWYAPFTQEAVRFVDGDWAPFDHCFTLHGVDHIERLIAVLVPVLPCGRVHTLQLGLGLGVEPECLRTTFGHRPLRSIIVHQVAAIDTVKALVPESSPEGLNTIPPPFPLLERLHLDHSTFRSSFSLRNILQESLRIRIRNGMFLNTLVVSQAFGFTGVDVERLRAFVKEVAWDEIVNHVDEEKADDLIDLDFFQTRLSPYDYFGYI